MSYEQLKLGTKRFALSVIKFVETAKGDEVTHVIGRQLLRSGTSVGANYRSACRARSNADFISKMGIVEEEADESAYWLELLEESGRVQRATATPLPQEANELAAIAVASIKTARKRK